jgi:hypothetical protein
MSLQNIYKLVTREDGFHIHKSLGIMCLCNFIYRYSMLWMYGTMDLNNPLGLGSILLHGLLSVSSLIFHIPTDRNPLSPMIYPEFRLHSIVFALRSVLCSICHYYSLPLQPLVCIATMMAADTVTAYANNTNQNGRTISNMPFDPVISEEGKTRIIHMNRCMQIGATLFMMGSIDSSFSSLFGIQIAAFLMTLVRKSIITSNTWHICYALSLWINILFVGSLPLPFILFHGSMYNLYTNYFFKWNTNKYANWTFIFAIYYTYHILNPTLEFGIADPMIRYGIIAYFMASQLYRSRALFIREI